MRTNNKQFLTALVACCAALPILAISGSHLLRWDRARCYAMPLGEFRNQAKLLQPGMAMEEAIECIKGYDETQRRGNAILLMMHPHRDGLIMPTIMQGITIRLDEKDRVVRFHLWDG